MTNSRNEKKYAVVTAVSTFHHYYVVPMDELQKLNTNSPVEANWLADSVTMQEVEEFSQQHLGEQIVDCYEIDEQSMLDLFDKQNDYLKDWPTEQKLAWVKKLLEIKQ